MGLGEFVLLLLAGVGAGLVGTVAGLASLVSYPALLAVGLPPIAANVTNTVSLVFNGIGAVSASRPELRGQGRRLAHLVPLTAGGSVVGAALLLLAPASSFERVVPFFIASAAVLLLFPGLLRRRTRVLAEGTADVSLPAADPEPAVPAAVVYPVVFVVGAYSGYFGAAAGVVMLALLSATRSESLARSNAVKNVVLGASNLVASVIFVITAPVRWAAVLPLAAGCLIGGLVGPSVVRHLPARLLRVAIGLAALGLAAVLFGQAYLG